MRGFDLLATQAKSGFLAILVLVAAGCTSYAPLDEPLTEVPVATVVTPPDLVEAPPQEPEPEVEIPVAPRPLPVAIVLTNSQPAYLDVAVELAGHFANHELYDLSNESVPPVAVLGSINDSDVATVIAIGLRAAQSSVAMAKVPVVFGQVFNYQDHELLVDHSRGVTAFAPPAAQLDAWKKINPELHRVGLIIGAGHEDLLEEAELAALRHEVELVVRIAKSDQESLYLFRRIIRDIDGFWLFPDNRILSTRVLKQMLEEAERLRVPVAGPNEAMLEMGMAISFSTVAADIAAKVAAIVRRIQAGEIDQVPSMTPLSELRVVTGDRQATREAVASASESP